MCNDYYIDNDYALYQIELEQQERIELDPEYRKEYETWLDSLPSNQEETLNESTKK